MYIAPNSVMHILHNCPLDTTYDHTIYFTSADDQRAYFQGLTKYTLNALTYQRVNSGKIRVQYKADDLYDCNYLMFQNTAYGQKWFYAFIKSIDFLNNITSEITYEIDIMQTWHFNYTLGQCFVEREHTSTDVIGENTLPENIETGPYITTNQSNLKVDSLGLYVLASEAVGEGIPWNPPAIVGGFPVPCYWLSLSYVDPTSMLVLKSIIDLYAADGKSEAIVAVFTAPYNMVSTSEDLRVQTLSGAARTLAYTPKNNKLYTYPYCCMALSALGQGCELQYELFDDGEPVFTIIGGFGANMQVTCIPNNYAGVTLNVDYMVSIKDFPVCAWVSNYFQNWLAQNKANIAVSTISAVANATVGSISAGLSKNPGGAVGSVVGGFTAVANQIANVYQHSIIPDKMTGSANAADIMAVAGLSGFYTSCKTIRPEYAKIIDDYFSMYGYKVNAVKIPNRDVRPHWTYTKTIGCVVDGNVPSDDMKKICEIYNNGITFWLNGGEIGNYSLDNSV